MKTRRPIYLATVVLILLCILVPSARAQTLNEIFESVLDLSIIAPLPSAICPLVEAAEHAETYEIAILEIAVAEREQEIYMEYITVDRERQIELERQKKACAQIKSELIRIKNIRTAREVRAKQGKEGGRAFTFHGRYEVSPTPEDWYDGDYDAWLIRDSFGDLPGDDPNGPISAVVTPTIVGCEGNSVPVLDGELEIWGDESSYFRNYPCVSLYFRNFSYGMGSFEIAPGVWTGINSAVLNPVGSPPVGEYNFRTSQFEMHFEGMFTNDLYDRSVPILFFASIRGAVPGRGGDGPDGYFIAGVPGRGGDDPDEYFIAGAPVAADVPMIVPLIRDAVELRLPKVMGAHVLAFDANTSTLTLLENTTLEPNPDIAMVRYSDGSYAIDPAVDEALGADIVVEPFSFAGESPNGVYNFADANISICTDVGSGSYEPILRGSLRNPVLDAVSGGFFADLEITDVSGSSPVLSQINSSTRKKVMQIAVGAVVYDLIELTEEFTISGRMPWPEVFHLGVVRDCDSRVIRSDFNSDWSINFKDFVHLARYWLQDEPLVDSAPPPEGDNIVDTRDLAALAECWLEQCE